MRQMQRNNNLLIVCWDYFFNHFILNIKHKKLIIVLNVHIKFIITYQVSIYNHRHRISQLSLTRLNNTCKIKK